MVRVFKLALVAAGLGLAIALVVEWAVVAGAFGDRGDARGLVVACLLEGFLTLAAGLAAIGVTAGSKRASGRS